jgi:hypothetical protein
VTEGQKTSSIQKLDFPDTTMHSMRHAAKTPRKKTVTFEATGAFDIENQSDHANNRARSCDQSSTQICAPCGERQKRHDPVIKDPMRYKTVPCKNWKENGKCPYGPRCQFAHGTHELRVRAAVPASEAPAPPQPMQPTPSPQPVCDAKTEGSSSRLDAGADQIQRVAPGESTTDEQTLASLPDPSRLLCVDDVTGEVKCRRDASYHTQMLRRQLSSLFEDASLSDSFEPLDLRGEAPHLSVCNRQPSHNTALISSVVLGLLD